MDDIIFYSNYFFFDMPAGVSGSIDFIEADTSWFTLTLTLPERISIS